MKDMEVILLSGVAVIELSDYFVSKCAGMESLNAQRRR